MVGGKPKLGVQYYMMLRKIMCITINMYLT